MAYEDNDEEDDEEDSVDVQSYVPFERLKSCDFALIYTHPEALQKTKFSRLLRTQKYQSQICAVVVDETHMISEWYT